MKLLPFEKHLFRSPLPPDEALKCLADQVEPPKWFRLLSGAEKPYQGEITGNKFQIRRIIGYRNSFLPRISGEIRPSGSGSDIAVTMQLHPAVLVFVLVWIAIPLISLLLVLGSNGQFMQPVMLFPTLMVFLVYLIFWAAFKWESSRARKDLAGFFQAID